MLTICSASSVGTPPGTDDSPTAAWERLLGRFADLFTRPSSGLFCTLITGWALCHGRRTVTRMMDVADPDGIHAHDAYHRFLREGKWDMTQLWRRLTPLLVSHLEGNLRLVLDLDDTLFHKAGRKVNGAGSFRDPIRSRGQRTVFAHGLNLVVLTLRVQPPWGGEPIGLPINMRRYRKRDGRSLLDLGQEMIEEVAAGCPTTPSSSAATALTPAWPAATCPAPTSSPDPVQRRSLRAGPVADPAQREHDDLLFCTDLTIPPELVASLYAGRWSIEDTFRNTKQLLGGEQPQTWKAQGPERASALSFWTYSAIWLWYLACHGDRPTWRMRPWYPAKRTPSFADALAALRRALWARRIFDASDSRSLLAKIPEALIDAVAEAA